MPSPLVLLAIGVVSGVWCAAALGPGPVWLAVVAMGVGTVATLVGARIHLWPRAWLAIPMLLGGLMASAVVDARAPDVEIVGDAVRARAVVERADRGTDDASVVRIVATGDPLAPTSLRARVRGLDLPEGARFEARLALRRRAPFRNPSPHPDWPVVAPITHVGRVVVIERIERGSLYARSMGALRERIRSGLVATLPEPSLGVARAMVLGDEGSLDDESAAITRASGLSHVLAVSGMHVTLVVGALVWAIARLLARVPRIARRIEPMRVACALGVPLALLYAELAGGAPSAWRAAITAAIAWSLRACGRTPRAAAVTALAAALFAITDPSDAPRPAFLLSIAATAAILGPTRAHGDEPPHPLGEVLRASVRAWIATAPIVLWCFGNASPGGVLANLVVVPVASAILLPLTTLHAAIATFDPALASPTAPIVDAACRAFLAAAEPFAALTAAEELPPLTIAQGVVLAALACTLLLARSLRARLIACALAALLFAASETHVRIAEQPRGVLRASFVDVGQGDAALLDMPDGRLVLVDAGGAPNGGPDPGARSILPLLRARRRERIDVAIITHPHPDHYGGLRALMESIPIGEIWDDGQGEAERPDGELAALLADARSRGITVRSPAELCDGPRSFGTASVEVLWPCPAFDPGLDPNDNSLVVHVRLGRRSMLFTGDIERLAEAELSQTLPRADVLKVPHHGSHTSTGAALLERVRPWLAIVSCGVGNRFGHPHADVLARLAQHRIELMRLDREGGVVVETDGRALRAHAWSGRDAEAR